MSYCQSAYKRLFVVSLSLLALLSSVVLPGAFNAPTSAATGTATVAPGVNTAVSEETQARARAAYGQLPLRFEMNQGQFDGRVKFAAHGAGFGLALTGDSAMMTLPSGKRETPTASAERGLQKQTESARDAKASVIAMRLVGSNRAAAVQGSDELPGRSNYIIGNNPAKWRTDVATYARVTYKSVYRGIDLTYYGNGRELEYDFNVAIGANPAAITMRFDGAKQLRLDANGDLIISTESGDVRQHLPVAYQTVAGQRREVTVRYVLRGNNQAGFALGSYDHGQPLVIDPILSYSTYLGGSHSFDEIAGIAVDAAGNAYVTGNASSTDFPVVNPIGSISSLPPCVFVTKLNPAGNALIYSTYISGSPNIATGSSFGAAIAVDAAGNAYVTGYTQDASFPTTPGAFQKTLAGKFTEDAFALKINAAGSALVYSTFLGGSQFDFGEGIAIDTSGNAYVTGETSSPDFPKVNALQATLASPTVNDAFVTKLNATGTALIYSTYLGGSGLDRGFAIAVDKSGSAYVTGATMSQDFPTANALQSGYHGRGAFASTNAGSSWTALNGSLPITAVQSVAIDPSNSSVLYIGTDQRGIFKSTNGGGGWTAINQSIPDLSQYGLPGLYEPVYDLEIDKNHPSILYAGMFAGGNTQSILKSTDGGNTWSQKGGIVVTSIKADPTNASIFYAADIVLGVLRSTDGGETWNQYGNANSSLGIDAVAVAPTTPPTVYAGTSSAGLYRQINPGQFGLVPNVPPGVAAIAVDPATPTTVYAGTARGVYKSTDNGVNWASMNTGLTYLTVNSLAIDPQTPSTVYAGTVSGLFKSTNGGISWAMLQVGISNGPINDIAVDSQTPSHLYAGATLVDDIFVTKLNAAGTALTYSTYLGGVGVDLGSGIAVDATGNAYVTGIASSAELQNLNSARPLGGDYDAFALKLNPAGTLGYFTYLGGSGSDYGHGIALDSTGNAYITGYTNSVDFPTTFDAVPLAGGLCSTCSYAFVSKVNPAGMQLLYSTYLGGNGADPSYGRSDTAGNAIAVDAVGNAYAAGYTLATNFPVTAGAFDTTYNGRGEGFVAKIAAFTTCVQDDSNGNLLQINTTTGDYQFTTCGGIVNLTGRATMTKHGCTLTLQDGLGNRRLVATIDSCAQRATASVQILGTGKTYTITDRNTANDTCSCLK